MPSDASGGSSKPLAPAVLDRLYDDLRAAHLGHLERAKRRQEPRATIFYSAPGGGARAAAALAARRPDAHDPTALRPDAALLGVADLASFHPHARHDPDQVRSEPVRQCLRRWLASLVADTAAARLDVAIAREELATAGGERELLETLAAAGYRVGIVVLACDQDRSRQGWLVRYDAALRMGLAQPVPLVTDHDDAFAALDTWVADAELLPSVDWLLIQTLDGRRLIRTTPAEAAQRRRETRRQDSAADILREYASRLLPARELADTVIRWNALVARLTSNRRAPQSVAAQALLWARAATARAERDPQGRQALGWGRAAAAFSALPPAIFTREFPAYAWVLDRVAVAVHYAEANFSDPGEREQFLALSHDRLAERIASGKIESAATANATRRARAKQAAVEEPPPAPPVKAKRPGRPRKP